MPKIIQNLRQGILSSARRQMDASGLDFTVAAVAGECGVAVGTIYNYFPSKELLVATVVAEDWQDALEALRRESERAGSVMAGIAALYEGMALFFRQHETIFRPETSLPPRLSFRARHELLRAQLAALVAALRARFDGAADEGLDAFLSEALLNWAVAEPDFSRVAPYFQRLAGSL